MTGDLRAGLAQWTPGRDPDVNLRKAEAALRELARRGCQLAVLPELSSGASYTSSRSYSPNGKPATRTLAPRSSRTGPIASMGSCGSVS
jgi:predicted amidohydrolase